MYARLGILALCCAVAFWLGDRLASGRYEARISDIAVAVSQAQVEAAERHNRELEAERKRAASASAARSQRRQVAQGIVHEITQDVDRSTEWRDAHRVRIERLYGAYGYAPDGSPTGVSDSVPDAALNSATSGAVGGSSIHLGRGLRSSTQ